MKFYATFYKLDTAVLHFFNVTLENPLADQFWAALSHLENRWWFTLILAPLILVYCFSIYRLRSWKIFFGVGLAVALSDLLCYRLVKAYVHRPRPFEDPLISSWLRHVGEAHGTSFPSNHAANCFAGAVVLSWFIPAGRDLFYIFALLVGISRIALGVHYPSDVIAGAILGVVVGYLVRFLVLRRFRIFRVRNSVSARDRESYNWRKRIRRLEDD